MRLIKNIILLASIIFYSSLSFSYTPSTGGCANLIRTNDPSSFSGACSAGGGFCINVFAFESEVSGTWYDLKKCPAGYNACPQGGSLNSSSTQCSASNTQYCASLGGSISSNMSCPSSPYTCPGGCGLSPSQAAAAGSTAGAGAGSAAVVSGGSSSSSGAQATGGGAGASAGVQSGASAGAGSTANNGSGFTPEQVEQLADAAKFAGEADGATAAQVQSEVIATCMNLVNDPQACGEISIAAGAGFQSGANSGAAAYQAATNPIGSSTNGFACVSTGDCNVTATFTCPSGFKWNGSSSNPQCDPFNPTPEPCNIYNNFCDVPDCGTNSFWNGSACQYAIPQASCPAGSTPDPQGHCQFNTVNTVPDMCPTGYVWNGISCNVPMSSETRTSVSRTTTDAAGNQITTTTSYVTSTPSEGTSSGTGSGEGEGETGAGECDPESKEYAKCIGQVEDLPDDDGLSQAQSDMQSSYDAAESEVEDFFQDIGVKNESSYTAQTTLGDTVNSIFPSSTSCSAVRFSVFPDWPDIELPMCKIAPIRDIAGWVLYALTVIFLFYLVVTTGRRV